MPTFYNASEHDKNKLGGPMSRHILRCRILCIFSFFLNSFLPVTVNKDFHIHVPVSDRRASRRRSVCRPPPLPLLLLLLMMMMMMMMLLCWWRQVRLQTTLNWAGGGRGQRLTDRRWLREDETRALLLMPQCKLQHWLAAVVPRRRLDLLRTSLYIRQNNSAAVNADTASVILLLRCLAQTPLSSLHDPS